jgi:hypothetical protein
MPCEKYQDALIDLAAGGSEVISAVREHLNVCASCRSYLEQEQVLFASVDSGVRQAINAPLPASLLQRLHARVAQQAPAKRIASTGWMYATAAAVVLIVLMLPVLRPRNAKVRMPSLDHQPRSASSTTNVEKSQADPLNAARVQRSPLQANKRAVPRTAGLNSEVLVPPDEREAFEGFLSDLNGRQDLAAALVKPMVERHERRDGLVVTPDIETAALVVEPLEKSDDK